MVPTGHSLIVSEPEGEKARDDHSWLSSSALQPVAQASLASPWEGSTLGGSSQLDGETQPNRDRSPPISLDLASSPAASHSFQRADLNPACNPPALGIFYET
ncbi:unnamed protein product [Clonostachys byssicola]|uniref:Uncharacterized protein n=1 Tax=Clonostachys byssicola TaxID=160290 RepID=A0A9N9UTU8_9HYPO|nr:unnamed protein product [Clonostachys byssicola]